MVSEPVARERLLNELSLIVSQKDLAAKVGVSPQRIEQILRPLLLTTRRLKDRRSCLWCKEMGTVNRRFCLKCYKWSHRTIITCDYCGAYKAISTKWAHHEKYDRRYTGRHFCSRVCSKLFLKGWRRKGHGKFYRAECKEA